MAQACRKFCTLIAVSHAEMSEYRTEILLWVLSSIMPFVLMGLWMKASLTADLGMGPVAFARYFYCVFLIRQLTLVWVVYEFENHVVRGGLSAFLLQPINPVWRYVAGHLGERLARLPFLILLTIVFFCLYPASLWKPSPGALLAGCVCIAVAFVLRFIMQYAFAMIAFWSERANAIEDLWFFMYLFLSGYVAPLTLFPPAVRRIAEYTPFPYLIYMPARILMGAEVDIARGLMVSAIWGVVFLLVYAILWRCGLRKYSAMGA